MQINTKNKILFSIDITNKYSENTFFRQNPKMFIQMCYLM